MKLKFLRTWCSRTKSQNQYRSSLKRRRLDTIYNLSFNFLRRRAKKLLQDLFSWKTFNIKYWFAVRYPEKVTLRFF